MNRFIVMTVLGLMLSASGVMADWSAQDSGTNSYLTDVHFVDAQRGWAVGSLNTVLHTDDGGDSWNEQSIPTSSNLSAVHFADAQNGWAVGSAGRIVHTDDGGQSWELQHTANDYLWDVFFLDANTGWAVGGDAPVHSPSTRLILKTVNGGLTWTTQHLNTYVPYLLAIHFSDPQNGVAVGEGGRILRTTDGGASWHEQSSGTLWHLRGVHMISPDEGWIVGQFGLILHTVDGGLNWEPVESGTGETFTDVEFLDENIGWAVGGANDLALILRTVDGGQSWEAQDSAVDQVLIGLDMIDEDTGWAVGFNGTIVHQIGDDITAAGGEVAPGVVLQPNYPNPFNPKTTISFQLEEDAPVSLKVYDVEGRAVRTLLTGRQSAGSHSVDWNGRDDLGRELSSGNYFYRLRAGDTVVSRKMAMIR